jgi:hypothetical protein
MLACKLDDTWFTGSYSLATAAMAIFEARQYDKTDSVALNSYGQSCLIRHLEI